MASKKTIRLTDAGDADLEAIRSNLLVRMPLTAEISDAQVVNHALHVVAEQARIENANLPKFKPPTKARKAARS